MLIIIFITAYRTDLKWGYFEKCITITQCLRGFCLYTIEWQMEENDSQRGCSPWNEP